MKCFSLLPHARPGDAQKGTSLGLGGGGNPFFVSYHVGKMSKFVNVCLKCPIFNHLLDTGPGDALKNASPGLGGGANPFFLCRIMLAKR